MNVSNIISKHDTHTIKRTKRSISAITLMVIYLLISLGPFISLVMHSKTVAHALTGECTGNCSTCGCSTESMATRTCCCAKKQQQAIVHKDRQDGTPDSCKKVPDRKQVVIASCGCPSERGKHAALSGSGTSELLPCYFTTRFGIPSTDTRFHRHIESLTSFQSEPPDPPPKISFRS